MTIQTQNSNLNYLIVPIFTNVNRLFVLSFLRNNTYSRCSYSNYYVPKNEGETYEKIIKMSNNNDYTMVIY